MVSEKMYELGTKKSTIRTIFEFGRKRAAEVGEDQVFDFSLGNPNVPTPDFIRDAAIDILKTWEPNAIHGYTVSPGAPQVRDAVAKSLNRRFSMDYEGKNIFMTAGAAAAPPVVAQQKAGAVVDDQQLEHQRRAAHHPHDELYQILQGPEAAHGAEGYDKPQGQSAQQRQGKYFKGF